MLTPEKIAEYRTDLLSFSKAMFKARKGADFLENWHHKEICSALEKVVIGKTKRLIINIPPRYSKTELAVINFIAWCMGNFPDCEFIHPTYSKRLATTNTWGARTLVEHELYTEIFGNIGLRNDSNAKDEWRTVSGGCVYATGAEGSITGYGAGKIRDMFGGCIIIDDPHKAGEATSDRMRQNVIDWFSTTLESRLNSKDTPIIVIMQRLHENDLSGWLLNGGNGEDWTHLCLPAIGDDGRALWPDKHDLEDLNRLDRSNNYVFAGQYMQRPAPLGGGVFKDEYWKYYEVLPKLKRKIIYADTAMKAKESNDYSVFQCWGQSKDNSLYLIDQVRGKWEAPELLTTAKAFYNKHRSGDINCSALKVEDKASGTGLIQQLTRERLPVVGIPRETDKYTRALGAVPYIQAGHVYLPSNAEWLSDYLKEHGQFPNAANDDQVDPTIDAIDDMLSGRNDHIYRYAT